jgi:hypothetical protein
MKPGFAASLFLIAITVRAAEPLAPAKATPAEAWAIDQPGEVQNPFTLSAGQGQSLAHVLWLSEAAREGAGLGEGGEAVVTTVLIRFGVVDRCEAQVAIDTFLSARSAGKIRRGVGRVTLRPKWNIVADPVREYGIGLAPFVRLPTARSLIGHTRAEPGIVFPFSVDLEQGWEIEGSLGALRERDDGGGETEFEGTLQAEWQARPRLRLYLGTEIEMERRQRQAEWAVEAGCTIGLNVVWHLDLVCNLGLGEERKARSLYIGLGWNWRR